MFEERERERESNKVGEGVGVFVLCCSHKDDFMQFTLIKEKKKTFININSMKWVGLVK